MACRRQSFPGHLSLSAPAFHSSHRQVYERLVAAGTLVPAPDKPVPPIPQDLASAVAQGKVTGPMHCCHLKLCACYSYMQNYVTYSHSFQQGQSLLQSLHNARCKRSFLLALGSLPGVCLPACLSVCLSVCHVIMCGFASPTLCRLFAHDACLRAGHKFKHVNLTVYLCPSCITHMQVRVPTHVVSTICDDRGDEPTYAGVSMSELIQGDYGVGDVVSGWMHTCKQMTA